MKLFLSLILLSICFSSHAQEATVGSSEFAFVEIDGVAAGAFNPEIWRKGNLNLVPDVRHPMLSPLPGKCRNIYAPSVVETDDGWRVFYGAWDGIEAGNDRIYSVTTEDFITFHDRHTVIHNGDFIHTCNVNAIMLPDGSYSMVVTAFPDDDGLNKPAFFKSPDGKIWNGTEAPHKATKQDIITMEGYEQFPEADINGMNVILYEDGLYNLFFSSFKDFRKVYRATSENGKDYQFQGKVLDGWFAVNDVKKLIVDGTANYLMGLHMNQDKLWYSLTDDISAFPEPKLLAKNHNAGDRYMVAHGWVVSGQQEEENRKVMGYLYGAGYHQGLAGNRIFARWLQKRVMFVAENGEEYEALASFGPDRQMLALPSGEEITGTLRVFAEDGVTLLEDRHDVTLKAGDKLSIE